MPILTMADGSEVEVPDNPTAELKEKIRAKNEQIKASMASQPQQQPQPAAPRQSSASQATLSRAVANQTEPRSLSESMGNIGAAGLTGAVAGAGGAETMALIGKGLQMVPWGPAQAAGAGLQVAAPALATLGGRLMGAGVGGASAAAGQATTEVLEQVGVESKYAVPLGAAATMVVPVAEGVLGALKGGTGKAWKAISIIAKGADESIPQAVQSAKRVLSSDPFAREPQLQVAASLAKANAEHMAKAKGDAARMVEAAKAEGAKLFRTDPKAAGRVVETAEAEGRRIVAEAAAKAKAIEMASASDLSKAVAVKVKADGALAKVSPIVPPSDTGNLIRGKVLPKQQAEIEARNTVYRQQKAERDAIVAAKEQSGVRIDQTPAMQELRAELKALLFPKAGTPARVTDAGTKAALQKIWDATSTQRRQIGVGADGNPTYASNPVSFEALDAVRRKLGDVAFGKEAEGYSALGQKIAQRYYAKLSKAQEEFAGPIQKAMQSGYAEATEGQALYKGKVGQAVLAADRHSEAFLKDPSELGASFFRSQQSVRDLRELTGDPQVVATAARQHAVRELAGKDSKQVAAWLRDPAQKDWLREVPGLEGELSRYAGELQVIERAAKKLQARGEAAAKRAGELLPEAEKLAAAARAKAAERAGKLEGAVAKEQKAAAGLQTRAEAAAAKSLEAAARQVKELAVGDFPVEGVNNLLRGSANAKQAAALIAREPGGLDALDKSLRSLMSGMGKERLQRFWSERGLDIVSGVLDRTAVTRLDAAVRGVLAAYEGRQAASRVQVLVARELAALAGYGAGQTGVGGKLAGD